MEWPAQSIVFCLTMCPRHYRLCSGELYGPRISWLLSPFLYFSCSKPSPSFPPVSSYFNKPSLLVLRYHYPPKLSSMQATFLSLFSTTCLRRSFLRPYAYLAVDVAYAEGLTADAVYQSLDLPQNHSSPENSTYSAEVEAFYA